MGRNRSRETPSGQTVTGRFLPAAEIAHRRAVLVHHLAANRVPPGWRGARHLVVVEVEDPRAAALRMQPGDGPVDRFGVRVDQDAVDDGAQRVAHVVVGTVVERDDDLVCDVAKKREGRGHSLRRTRRHAADRQTRAALIGRGGAEVLLCGQSRRHSRGTASTLASSSAMRDTVALRRNEAGPRAQGLRQLEAELLGQTPHVLPVDVVELRMRVPLQLELRSDAGNLDITDPAGPCEALTRPAIRRTAGRIGLPAVAVFIESQWMAVDLAPPAVMEDEACRPLDVGPLELGQNLADAIDILEADAEVEVIVHTCLLPEERIDTPATLNPEGDSGLPEPVEHVEDVAGAQLNCACVRSRPSASSVSTASAARVTIVSASSSGRKSEST